MFKLLCALLALHTTYAVAKGEVVGKSGPGARNVSCGESPRYSWCVVVIYAGLALALVSLFRVFPRPYPQP